MKLAVVTPYKAESSETLGSCIRCVENQSYNVTMHVIICDGGQLPIPRDSLPDNVHIIDLQDGCEDTGATPRAIGSIYAIANFCDGIAYLDADNTWTEDHISNAVQEAEKGAQIIITDRWICEYDTGKPMYLDTKENCISVVDTNTLVLVGDAIASGTEWWRIPRKKGYSTAGVDRYLWKRISAEASENNMKIARTHKPSVLYRSRWLGHYAGLNIDPPNPSKVIEKHDGMLVAKWVKPVRYTGDGKWECTYL